MEQPQVEREILGGCYIYGVQEPSEEFMKESNAMGTYISGIVIMFKEGGEIKYLFNRDLTLHGQTPFGELNRQGMHQAYKNIINNLAEIVPQGYERDLTINNEMTFITDMERIERIGDSTLHETKEVRHDKAVQHMEQLIQELQREYNAYTSTIDPLERKPIEDQIRQTIHELKEVANELTPSITENITKTVAGVYDRFIHIFGSKK